MDGNLIFVEAGQFSAEYTSRDGKTAKLTLEQWQAMGCDKNSIFADPLFVDAETWRLPGEGGVAGAESGVQELRFAGCGVAGGFSGDTFRILSADPTLPVWARSGGGRKRGMGSFVQR